MVERYTQTDLVRLSFEQSFELKGKTFGQSGKASGVSDGSAGVQWNALYDPESSQARLGVNLEGITYDGWPIARFIERELDRPALATGVAIGLEAAEKIIVNLRRDAWQVSARLPIDEWKIGDLPTPLSQLSVESWIETLEEAYQCLDAKRGFRGRAEREVTLSVSGRRVVREVSPHLNISTVIWSGAIGSEQSARNAISLGRERLAPIHNYVSGQSALVSGRSTKD
jgi:hypothetical protein